MDKSGFSPVDTQYYDTNYTAVTTDTTENPKLMLINDWKRNFLDWFKSFFAKSQIVYQLFYFAYFAAYGSLFPLISIYFKQLGLNAIQCGTLSGIRSLTDCFAVPFWIALADKWKKAKVFVIISLTCSMILTLGLGFVRPTPEGCLVSLPKRTTYDNDTNDGLALTIVQPYKSSRYDDIKSVDMDRDLALQIRNEIGQSPLYLDTKLLVTPPKMKATRWGTGVGRQAGDQSLYSRTEIYHDPTQYPPGSLVMPLYSTVVYSQTKINQVYILIVFLVLFGELLSCVSIPLVDAAVKQQQSKQQQLQQNNVESLNTYEKQRIVGSIGWALAMFFIGLTLDHSTTFPDYPCLHPGYREKNYIVCFATYSVFISFALFISTQFSFQYEGDQESMYFKLFKDKMARIFLGRTTKSRSKLVNEENEFNNYDENKLTDQTTTKTDNTLNSESTNTQVMNNKKQSNEELLEQQLGIKFDRKVENNITDASHTKSATIDYQQEELAAAAAQLKVTRWLHALKQFRNPQLLAFLLVTWFMGLGVGQVFTFLFWHMQELNGSPTLFGIASIINHISEILMYHFSQPLIDKIGHLKVLYLGLIGNVARFLYVSWISNPWLILPFEFLQGLTHAGVWVTCCSYITQAFQPEFRSTTQGFLRAIHYGLGRGMGAIFGGLVISSYGTSAMFRSYGAASAIVLLGFLLLNYLMPIPASTKQQEETVDEDQEFDKIGSRGFEPGLQSYNINPTTYNSSYQASQVTHDYYLQKQTPLQSQQQQPNQSQQQSYGFVYPTA